MLKDSGTHGKERRVKLEGPSGRSRDWGGTVASVVVLLRYVVDER